MTLFSRPHPTARQTPLPASGSTWARHVARLEPARARAPGSHTQHTPHDSHLFLCPASKARARLAKIPVSSASVAIASKYSVVLPTGSQERGRIGSRPRSEPRLAKIDEHDGPPQATQIRPGHVVVDDTESVQASVLRKDGLPIDVSQETRHDGTREAERGQEKGREGTGLTFLPRSYPPRPRLLP